MNENYSHAAIILPTGNMSRSLAFYTEKLGFEITFTWEEPITYAVLKSGEISLHLSLIDGFRGPKQNLTALYIFVHDIEKAYKELKENGVSIRGDFEEREYKMKDFDIVDSEGHIITFGKGS